LDRLIPSDAVDLVGRVGWLVDAARGLEHLHHKRVVHGDVKPENVMLGRGRAKIGDLGMAKYVEEEGNEQGTRWYVAPEVL
jgi:serine/threonine protein kinase